MRQVKPVGHKTSLTALISFFFFFLTTFMPFVRLCSVEEKVRLKNQYPSLEAKSSKTRLILMEQCVHTDVHIYLLINGGYRLSSGLTESLSINKQEDKFPQE